MERVPYSKYTKELRLEAVRLVPEGGLSDGEASMRLMAEAARFIGGRCLRHGVVIWMRPPSRTATRVFLELSSQGAC
jgi:hypothetical protein